jgi:Flp pilus assembly protein TadD
MQTIPPAHGDYLPLTILSYWIDYQWWGLNPKGYHLTNVILHSANTGLLFYLLIRLTTQPVQSLIIALLCSLHPVNTEVVAWIAERKSLLAMFWMLASFLFFLGWQHNQHSSQRYFSVSLFCYLLACLSKTAVVFFPLLLMAYQLCLQKKPFRHSLATITPFALLSVATAIIRIVGHAASGQMEWHPFETLGKQILTIVKLFGQYLVTLFLPLNLNNSYPLETARTVFAPGVLLGILGLAGILIIMLRSFRAVPLMCFGLAWYLAAWLPHSQIIAIPPALRADRYVYYSAPGLWVALVFGMKQCITDGTAKPFFKRQQTLFLIGALLTAGFFASMSIMRSAVWSNSIALWQDSIKNYYANPLAHNNLGAAYFKQGMLEEAIAEFTSALSFNPRYADPHDNLGAVYLKKEMIDDAIASYKRAVALKPSYAEASHNLACAYLQQGMLPEAISEFKKVIAIAPDFTEAHYKLGQALEAQGNLGDALKYYHTTVHLDPAHHQAYNNLAWIYATAPHQQIRNGKEAVANAIAACELTGFKRFETVDSLAAAYAEQGDFVKALEYQQRALELAPPSAQPDLQGRLQHYRESRAYRDNQ